MTTETTTTTETLKSLTGQLEKERTKLIKIRRDRDAYTAETDRLAAEYTGHCHDYPEELNPKDRQPLEGTNAKKLQAELAARQVGLPREQRPNPHTSDYEKQRDKVNDLAGRIEEFRVRNADTLVAEIDPPAEEITAGLEAAWTDIRHLLNQYEAHMEQARELIGATPGLNGQHVAHDGRITEWAKTVADALDNPVFIPRVSDMGRYELDRQIKQYEANNG